MNKKQLDLFSDTPGEIIIFEPHWRTGLIKKTAAALLARSSSKRDWLLRQKENELRIEISQIGLTIEQIEPMVQKFRAAVLIEMQRQSVILYLYGSHADSADA